MNIKNILDGSKSLKNWNNGTPRLISPQATLDKVTPLLPIFGITRIANVTGLDYLDIPVTMIVRPNSRSLSVSQGKGITLEAAKASGVMEAIELYHAEHINLPLRLATYEEVRYKYNVVDPRRFQSLPNSNFHNNLTILWIEAVSLIDETTTLVPFELVHTNCSIPLPAGSGCFPLTSNGLASGNHLVEALSHGICEVVERDAIARWQRGGPARQLDLATVDDLQCQEVLNKYRKADVEVTVWDITSRVGLPTFYCIVSPNPATNQFRQLYSASGAGCHPDKAVALLRALTEAAQSRLTFISGSRDDAFRNIYEQARTAPVHQHGICEKTQKDYREGVSWKHETFEEDLLLELTLLRERGLTEILAVDLTKPEFGIAVVRVIIPGLELSLHKLKSISNNNLG